MKSAELSLPNHNAKMAAMETLNTTGTWWVPSKGQSRAAGTLTFSENDGLRLEIDKSLELGKEKIIVGRAGGRELTHLIDWVATSGIKTSYSADKKFTVTYQRPGNIFIVLPEATLTLAFSGRYPFGGPTLTIQESVRWKLTANTQKTIDGIMADYITPLWNLLRLSTMRDNTLEQLAVYRKADDKPGDAIRVIFKTGYIANRSRRLSPGELLFSLADIGISPADFIRNG